MYSNYLDNDCKILQEMGEGFFYILIALYLLCIVILIEMDKENKNK